jgi:hypothetical protein
MSFAGEAFAKAMHLITKSERTPRCSSDGSCSSLSVPVRLDPQGYGKHPFLAVVHLLSRAARFKLSHRPRRNVRVDDYWRG